MLKNLTARFGDSAGPFYLTLIAFALLAPLVTGSVSTAGAVLVFAIAAAACNLMLGYAGLLSFAQGSFFGVGSYVVGITLKAYPGVELGALVVCVIAGMLLALAIGALSIRQRGIYFVMITLAMAQLAFFVSLALPGWTGGENGLLDIPGSYGQPALDMNLENLDVFSFLAMAYANKGDAAKSASFVEQYRERAEAAGVKGPRIDQPHANSPAAYVSYFHEKLLPDWERAGLP